MRSFLKIIGTVVTAIVLAYGIGTLWPPSAVNPDPNHAHADFAVWVNGEKLDFSGPQYMSAPPAGDAATSLWIIPGAFAHGDVDDGHTVPGREYLHLHNGIGHVVHRHKPGFTVGDFFLSIGFAVASEKINEFCWYRMKDDGPFDGCLSGPMHLYVNGQQYTNPDAGGITYPFGYVFQDLDRLLLTDATDEAEIARELSLLTSDACLYSRTCPWRGEPPAEGCVADPTVPCTE